jgi:hypothetical protein
MCSGKRDEVEDRPLTKEEEEALQEYCMIMGDFIDEMESLKTELDLLSAALTEDKDEA